MVKEKIKPVYLQKDDLSTEKSLVLFNDDVNSFDFVIEALIDVCGHEPEQAEQCAMIAHFKGKCNAKSGDYHSLKPLYAEMTQRGLTVSID
jgi:ATP-dependent Clp protease adaptor protein ClpS